MKLGRRLRRQSNVCSSLNCLKQCEEWSGICSLLEVSLETKRSSVADRCGETLLQSERRRGTTQALGELNLERWEKKIKRIFKAQSFLCSRKPALRKQEGTASVIGSGNYAHQCPKYGTHWGHQHWVHFWQGRAPSTLQQHRQPRVAVSSSPSWCANPARALQAGNKIQGCCTGARVCWQWLKKELKKKPKNLKIWGETFSNTQHNRYRINEVSVFFSFWSHSVCVFQALIQKKGSSISSCPASHPESCSISATEQSLSCISYFPVKIKYSIWITKIQLSCEMCAVNSPKLKHWESNYSICWHWAGK